MSKKREMRKQEILKKATKVWQGSLEEERSLKPLAEACGITKQALYRYFPNKQSIMDNLRLKLKELYEIYKEEMILLAEEEPTPFSSMVKVTATFIDQHWELISLCHKDSYSQDGEDCNDAQEFHKSLEAISGVESVKWNWFFNCTIAILWQLKTEKKGSLKANVIEMLEKKVTLGFAGGVIYLDSFREKIEKNPKGKVEFDENQNKITVALLKAIEEKGGSHLSLAELAQHAGMVKSSFYNYYESKEKLLLSIIEDVQRDFSIQRDRFLKSLKGSVERLYGHVLFLSRYIQEVPGIKVLITEFNSKLDQELQCKSQEENQKHLSKVFQDAVDQSLLTDDLLNAKEMMELISFSVGMDLLCETQRKSPEERAYQIFNFFAGGIVPDNSEPIRVEDV